MRGWRGLHHRRQRQAHQLHRHAKRDRNGKRCARSRLFALHLASAPALTFPRPRAELHFVRLLGCSRQLQTQKVRSSAPFSFLVVDLVFRCSVGERYQVPDDKKSENAVFVVETMANEGGSLRRMTFDGAARGGSMHEH